MDDVTGAHHSLWRHLWEPASTCVETGWWCSLMLNLLSVAVPLWRMRTLYLLTALLVPPQAISGEAVGLKADHINFDPFSKWKPTSARRRAPSPRALSIHTGHLLGNCPRLCDPALAEWRLHMLTCKRGVITFTSNIPFTVPLLFFLLGEVWIMEHACQKAKKKILKIVL